MTLRYTQRANAQLDAILSHVASRSPIGAANLLARIEEIEELPRLFPLAGRMMTIHGIRRIPVVPSIPTCSSIAPSAPTSSCYASDTHRAVRSIDEGSHRGPPLRCAHPRKHDQIIARLRDQASDLRRTDGTPPRPSMRRRVTAPQS